MKKSKQPPAVIPDEYREVWDSWLYYKKVQHKFTYADPSFEYIGFQKLLRYSNNNIDIAREIIEDAIGAGWAGFFKPKQTIKKATNEQARQIADLYFGRGK